MQVEVFFFSSTLDVFQGSDGWRLSVSSSLVESKKEETLNALAKPIKDSNNSCTSLYVRGPFL